MTLSDHVPLIEARASRIARRIGRLLPGSTFAAVLATLPRLAHAAEGGSSHEPAVLIAFGVLVAAAIVSTIATTRRRRTASADLAQRDFSGSQYGDQHVQ